MRKPKLSGAQRRKLAKERARQQFTAQGGAAEPQLLPRGQLPTLQDLESPVGCRHQLNRRIIAALAGQMHVDDLAKFVYALDKSAGMRRMELELEQRDALIAELQRRNELLQLGAGTLPALAQQLPADPLAAAVDDGDEVQP